MLAENASNLSSGPVLIIGCRFDNDGHAARRVTFVHDLLELLRILALAGAAFDRALDVIVRHTLGARSLDRALKPLDLRQLTRSRHGWGFLCNLLIERANFRITPRQESG